MGLEEVRATLESPEGTGAAAVRLHDAAVRTVAATAPQLIDALGLTGPFDVDTVPPSVLVQAIAERSNDLAKPGLFAVASAVDEVEAAASRLPSSVQVALVQMTDEFDAAPDLDALGAAIESARGQFGDLPGLGDGLELAQAIVADGASGLYTPDGPLATAFQPQELPDVAPETRRRRIWPKIKRTALEDVGGAGLGAASGAVIGGGAGAVPGAISGAIIGSGRSVLKRVWDRIAPDN
jgi:hypothetical protein